ncbi:MAG: (deoxy)nucleoside triphosphate pyrophosphohydrolase [Desulfotalea sp.]
MDTVKVVCGLIYDDDKIFICRRSPEKSLGGYWEFPGGKVEVNESYEECLKRELNEELKMDVHVLTHFKTITHHYDNFIIELISFVCRFKSSQYTMTDHDEYEWIKPKELLNRNLSSADIPIARALVVENFRLT